MIVITFFVRFFIILLLLAGFGGVIGLALWSFFPQMEKEEPLDISISITLEKEKASDISNTPS